MSTSLIQLLRSTDEDFIKRMEGKVKHVKEDKKSLLTAAQQFNARYAKEVEEGTKQRQMLLENGRKMGKTDDEIVGTMAVFIPSKNTPILNLLHFLMYEYKDVSNDIQVLREEKDVNTDHTVLTDALNKKFGHLNFEELEKDIPDILDYIYANVTTEIFKKIKKLKALSRSPNKEEAFSAYSKAMELCKKYNLDFDKIRCEVD